MKTLKIAAVGLLLFLFSNVALASNVPPPSWAGGMDQFMYFLKTQGLEWGLGAAAIIFGGSKMLNLDQDWAKKGTNLLMGAGVAFAMPDFLLTIFGRSGFELLLTVVH